jgi:universal stress protein E
MSKIECILIVVDPTADSHPAVERGMQLAKFNGMRVDLFVCDYNSQLVGSNFLNAEKLDRAKHGYIDDKKDFLHELAATYVADGIDVSIKAAWDRPLYEGIIRQALHSDARYVIKDTHYHSKLNRTLFTNTDWHLIRSCPAPLWLVQPGSDFSTPTILASVDPLHENDKPATLDARLLSEAFEIADDHGGIVHAFHAFNPYIDPDHPKRAESLHKEALNALMSKLEVPEDRIHMGTGNTTDLLPRVAKEVGAALVVMGAVSRSRLEQAIVGSTAEIVLDRLPCDVLVVKPHGFISPVTFRTAPKGVIYADE